MTIDNCKLPEPFQSIANWKLSIVNCQLSMKFDFDTFSCQFTTSFTSGGSYVSVKSEPSPVRAANVPVAESNVMIEMLSPVVGV
jgi:hypothetical protein